jgi:hypothetical protein
MPQLSRSPNSWTGQVSDDRRHELFARSLRIAQDTALRDKRRALGRAGSWRHGRWFAYR